MGMMMPRSGLPARIANLVPGDRPVASFGLEMSVVDSEFASEVVKSLTCISQSETIYSVVVQSRNENHGGMRLPHTRCG